MIELCGPLALLATSLTPGTSAPRADFAGYSAIRLLNLLELKISSHFTVEASNYYVFRPTNDVASFERSGERRVVMEPDVNTVS